MRGSVSDAPLPWLVCGVNGCAFEPTRYDNGVPAGTKPAVARVQQFSRKTKKETPPIGDGNSRKRARDGAAKPSSPCHSVPSIVSNRVKSDENKICAAPVAPFFYPRASRHAHETRSPNGRVACDKHRAQQKMKGCNRCTTVQLRQHRPPF